MKLFVVRFCVLMGGVFLLLCAWNIVEARTQESKSAQKLVILDASAGMENRLQPNCNQVSLVRSSSASAPGFLVTIKPGKEEYPGVRIRPALNSWNLSTFGHVEARVANTGAKPLLLALRVDNAGDWKDNPWNTETVTLEPGASDTLTAIFGFSYGHKRGFALKPEAVVNMMFFVLKSDDVQSFRIESVLAAGSAGEKPPPAPDEIRLKPVGGVVFGYKTTVDLSTQVQAQGVKPLLVGTDTQPSLKLSFTPGSADASVLVRPAIGRWDLHEALELKIEVRNMGNVAFTPKARLSSNGGQSDWVTTAAPLPPGGKGTIAISFAGPISAVVGNKEAGSKITSDAVSGVTIEVDTSDRDRVLYVDSIQADMPRQPELPEWLGLRPPVTGDWVKTLDDEFDGTTIDSSIWSIYGENYYDKVTHWSKEDVIVKGGVVRLRYEKKTGFANDDPKRPRSEYAAGYLQTYDKWAQRYGYFEARMKLPKAPGLWPAFWMMPDRGRGATQGSRQDTAGGGMEFDIMEHLTRWGPNRYNISLHYDGYGAVHKAVGSDKIYVQPDKDGYITCGLLWTPGSAVFYCNGLEVLRWEDQRVCSVPCGFLFTIPSGGWDNNALEDTQLPADFIIDYVRVWQRKDLATPGDGKMPPIGGKG